MVSWFEVFGKVKTYSGMNDAWVDARFSMGLGFLQIMKVLSFGFEFGFRSRFQGA